MKRFGLNNLPGLICHQNNQITIYMDVEMIDYIESDSMIEICGK